MYAKESDDMAQDGQDFMDALYLALKSRVSSIDKGANVRLEKPYYIIHFGGSIRDDDPMMSEVFADRNHPGLIMLDVRVDMVEEFMPEYRMTLGVDNVADLIIKDMQNLAPRIVTDAKADALYRSEVRSEVSKNFGEYIASKFSVVIDDGVVRHLSKEKILKNVKHHLDLDTYGDDYVNYK